MLQDKKKPTRADVASRAGISQTTVAYVLNKTPGVKVREETRAKVIQAASELGYTPSFSARSMKRGKTQLVGILAPAPSSQFHPYYSQILHGVYEAAADSDYHFLSLNQDRQAKYRRCLSQNYLDGVIILQSDDNTVPLQDVLEYGLPVVTMNFLHSLTAPQVTMDYEAAMKEAVDSLLKDGAKNLLFVHGAWQNQPIKRYQDRYATLRKRHRNCRFDTFGNDRYRLEPEQITQLLKEGWDGLIVDGYDFARDIAHHADFRSKPLSMVTFSESALPVALGETVTILQSQAKQVGQLAWEELLAQLEGRPTEASVHSIPFQHINPQSK